MTNSSRVPELVNAMVGELYRYRLAIKDQELRIQTAVEKVGSERQRISAEMADALFGPSSDIEEFERTIRGIKDGEILSIWRLKTDAQFLVSATYQVHLTAQAIRDLTEGDQRVCVETSLAAFREDVPDPDLLRHIHEHYGDYLRGDGREAHRLPAEGVSLDDLVAMTGVGLVYWIGGRMFVLRDVALAADRLAEAVASCVGEGPTQD